jgi:Glutathione S-transferase, N-terminal domain
MAGTLKLYYLPGSCALAPHIALEHAGAAYEAVRVERGRQSEPEYLRVNPLGRGARARHRGRNADHRSAGGAVVHRRPLSAGIARAATRRVGALSDAALDGIFFEHCSSGLWRAVAQRTLHRRQVRHGGGAAIGRPAAGGSLQPHRRPSAEQPAPRRRRVQRRRPVSVCFLPMGFAAAQVDPRLSQHVSLFPRAC